MNKKKNNKIQENVISAKKNLLLINKKKWKNQTWKISSNVIWLDPITLTSVFLLKFWFFQIFHCQIVGLFLKHEKRQIVWNIYRNENICNIITRKMLI